MITVIFASPDPVRGQSPITTKNNDHAIWSRQCRHSGAHFYCDHLRGAGLLVLRYDGGERAEIATLR